MKTVTYVGASLFLVSGACVAHAASLSTLNGVYSAPASHDGTSYSRIYLSDPSHNFRVSDLAPGTSAIFSTTVALDAHASTWSPTSNGMGNVLTVGLAAYDGINPQPAHIYGGSASAQNGAPLIYFQTNNPFGVGEYWNDKFYDSSDNWVFGNAGLGGLPRDNADQSAPLPGSNAKYTVTVNADNTFSETVTALDANGNAVTNKNDFPQNPMTLTGTIGLPTNTLYIPIIRMSPGWDTGYDFSAGTDKTWDPNANWSFTVSDSQINGLPQTAVPEIPAPMLGAIGLGVMRFCIRRRRRRA